MVAAASKIIRFWKRCSLFHSIKGNTQKLLPLQRFLRRSSIRWKNFKKSEKADIILHFLRELTRCTKAGRTIMRIRHYIILIQRAMRDYLICKRARLSALNLKYENLAPIIKADELKLRTIHEKKIQQERKKAIEASKESVSWLPLYKYKLENDRLEILRNIRFAGLLAEKGTQDHENRVRDKKRMLKELELKKKRKIERERRAKEKFDKKMEESRKLRELREQERRKRNESFYCLVPSDLELMSKTNLGDTQISLTLNSFLGNNNVNKEQKIDNKNKNKNSTIKKKKMTEFDKLKLRYTSNSRNSNYSPTSDMNSPKSPGSPFSPKKNLKSPDTKKRDRFKTLASFSSQNEYDPIKSVRSINDNDEENDNNNNNDNNDEHYIQPINEMFFPDLPVGKKYKELEKFLIKEKKLNIANIDKIKKQNWIGGGLKRYQSTKDIKDMLSNNQDNTLNDNNHLDNNHSRPKSRKNSVLPTMNNTSTIFLLYTGKGHEHFVQYIREEITKNELFR